MQVLDQCLDGLKYGCPQIHLNLTTYPLLVTDSPEPGYVTLAAAMAAGYVSIREVDEAGSVPSLLLKNSGSNPILVLDGEELIGAKQNRIANCTILAPAHDTITIPVSCVEAGRWSYDSDEFNVSDRAQFMDARRAKMAKVSESLHYDGLRDADQHDVWAKINEKAARMEVQSQTGAMADLYEQHGHSIQTYVDAFTAVDGQVGAVFAVGRRIEGMELFNADRTFGELLPKIVRSYAIDAMERPLKSFEANVSAAPRFVQGTKRAHAETYRAVGLGTDLRLRGHGIIAAGLIYEDSIVHLAAFAAPATYQRTDGEDDTSDRLERFLARRRFDRAA